jgi:hypothetical protein
MKKMTVAILSALLAIGSFSFVINAGADYQVQGTWMHMRGIITYWGTDRVFGLIGAHAGMVNRNGSYHEWARVHAIWSYDHQRLNCSGPPPPPQNFTFTFYAARLVETTEVAFNYSGYAFYISGLWNVAKVNITITVITDETGQIVSIDVNRHIEPVVINATGELGVLVPQFLFKLSIEGIETLGGFVKLWVIKHTEIKICDINDDGRVDIFDLVKVAKIYRTVPGLFDYQHHMDFNFNDQIDLGDLTTVAANIEG